MQQHPQQQQSHRSFYRGNRPGNLNIASINQSEQQSNLSSPFANNHSDSSYIRTPQSSNQLNGNQAPPPLQSPSHYNLNQNSNNNSQNYAPNLQRQNSNKCVQTHVRITPPLAQSPYLNNNSSQIQQNSNYANYSTVTSSPHYTQNSVAAPSPSYQYQKYIDFFINF